MLIQLKLQVAEVGASKMEQKFKKGAHYTAFNNDVDVTLHGGIWIVGVSCGSRAVCCNNYLWVVNTNVGRRLACDSL